MLVSFDPFNVLFYGLKTGNQYWCLKEKKTFGQPCVAPIKRYLLSRCVTAAITWPSVVHLLPLVTSKVIITVGSIVMLEKQDIRSDPRLESTLPASIAGCWWNPMYENSRWRPVLPVLAFRVGWHFSTCTCRVTFPCGLRPSAHPSIPCRCYLTIIIRMKVAGYYVHLGAQEMWQYPEGRLYKVLLLYTKYIV